MNLLTQKNYRVFLDESYKYDVTEERKNKAQYAELHGKYGMIYPFSVDQLAVTFTSKRVSQRFSKRENWKTIQNGEFETTCLFPDADLRLVAGAIKAKRRRQVSPEAVAKLLANLKKPQ